MSHTTNKNAKRGGAKITAQPTKGIEDSLTQRPVVIPSVSSAIALRDSEFFRLPKPKNRCALSGLSRTTILERGEAGDLKLIRLRKRGSQRGIVLVETSSFLNWLHAQPPVVERSKEGATA